MFSFFNANNNSYLNSHILDNKSKLQLLDYNYFYQKNCNDINKKINLSKFKPHKLWLEWNKNYFLSISHNKLLDLTSFGTEKNKSYKITNKGKNIKFFNYQINVQSSGEYFNNSFLKKNSNIIINEIEKLFKNPRKNLKKYLVIGAGNAYEICRILKKFPKIKIAIIDLPEVINSGYLSIKNLNKKIKINLPNNAKKFSKSHHQINYYFPYQLDLINEKFDMGNNIGSFQEMDIRVVNNYLDFVFKRLKNNGFFISINSERSRYIKNNSIKKYNLKNFEILNLGDIVDFDNKKILTLKKL